MTISVLLPAALASYAGGRREITVEGGTTTIAGLLDRLAVQEPALERRLRDELGRVRRHVNLYVDNVDVRTLEDDQTPVPEGAAVHVLGAISGG